MDKWKKAREIILTKTLKSRTWASDQKNLLKIIEAAQVKHLDASDFERAPLSNLRTIIKAAKSAIENGDHIRLQALFELAADLSNVDLRLRIGIRRPEEVMYEKVVMKGQVYYQLKLATQQLERIRASSKSYFIYKENHNTRSK
jgi:hypothetical protein